MPELQYATGRKGVRSGRGRGAAMSAPQSDWSCHDMLIDTGGGSQPALTPGVGELLARLQHVDFAGLPQAAVGAPTEAKVAAVAAEG